MDIFKEIRIATAKTIIGIVISVAITCLAKKLLSDVVGSTSYNSNVASALYAARSKYEKGEISKDKFDRIVNEL
jgi:uncharacterized membrane protein